jgi:hypothetical protein
MLTPNQVETIKSFPSEIVQYARKCLHSHPERKNNFQWIYESCIAECKVRNLQIEDTLLKHGYNNHKPTWREKQAMQPTTGHLSRQMHKIKIVTYTQQEAELGVKKILDDTESFLKMSSLFGEDVVIKLQKKMIDNIINRIT